jgi:hypothetical protein
MFAVKIKGEFGYNVTGSDRKFCVVVNEECNVTVNRDEFAPQNIWSYKHFPQIQVWIKHIIFTNTLSGANPVVYVLIRTREISRTQHYWNYHIYYIVYSDMFRPSYVNGTERNSVR